eukprot:gene17054-23349_t
MPAGKHFSGSISPDDDLSTSISPVDNLSTSISPVDDLARCISPEDDNAHVTKGLIAQHAASAPVFELQSKKALAGGTLEIVKWYRDRMLRVWTPPVLCLTGLGVGWMQISSGMCAASAPVFEPQKKELFMGGGCGDCEVVPGSNA